MRPYTQDRPKAMVEVAGVPIIERQITWLVRNGVTKLVVSCGYMADVIQRHIGEGSSFGATVVYAVEEEALGRGGGLKFGSKYLYDPVSPWMGLNGDVIADFDIAEMAAKHEKLVTVATIALAQYQTRWGIADLDGDFIRGFVQDPKLPYWINAGIYCFQPEFADLLPDKGDHEDSTFPDLAADGKLGAYFIAGYWRGIDTLKDIEEATAEIKGK